MAVIHKTRGQWLWNHHLISSAHTTFPLTTLYGNNDEPKCTEMPNLSNSTLTEFTKLVIGHQNRVRAWNILAAQRQLLFVQTSSPDSLNVIPAELVSALALLIVSCMDALEEFL